MISFDVTAAIVVMAVLFLRHAAVYKEPNKIGYAPLLLGIGIGGALIHFILLAEVDNTLAVLKESLLVFLVGMLLWSLMEVMSRSVSSGLEYENRLKLEQTADSVESLRHQNIQFAQKFEAIAQMEHSTHEQLREIFKEEIEALGQIQSNQKVFVSKIESLLAQQHAAMEKFEEFTLTELPGLDNVVHRHIDLLRVAEQDHFNHLKHALRLSNDSGEEMTHRLAQLHEQLERIETRGLGEHTMGILHKELGRIVHEFGSQMQSVAAKSEAMVTAMLENRALLQGAREQSEMIMQQMVLSSKQMREITSHSKELSDSLKPLKSLFITAESLHDELSKAKNELSALVASLETFDKSVSDAKEEMERMVHAHEQPLPIGTKNIHELSGRAKLHKSYIGENQA